MPLLKERRFGLPKDVLDKLGAADPQIKTAELLLTREEDTICNILGCTLQVGC